MAVSGAITSFAQAAIRRVRLDRGHSGSIIGRMTIAATVWITVLLFGGGLLLDRVLTLAVTRSFDSQFGYLVNSLIVSAEVGPDGEVLNNRELADQRFTEPNSGAYWQVTGQGHEPYRSRSLWRATLPFDQRHNNSDVHFYDSARFVDKVVQPRPDLEKQVLRIAERDVRLPGSPTRWRFQIALSREPLDAQITLVRRTMIAYFAKLGLGLIVMVGLQTTLGLLPLRRLRSAIAAIRNGKSKSLDCRTPSEVMSLVQELNVLVAHNDRQSDEARRHAGNLAHALKTPLSVLINAAAAGQHNLAATVLMEVRKMRRQVDHHVIHARVVGRRSSMQSRAQVWPSIAAVERAVARLYPAARIDTDGSTDLVAQIEQQDLEDLLGNLIENAAKYGGGNVFITVGVSTGYVEIMVEDDGAGIPEADRVRIFDRGVRLDSGKPGTGLGLSTVRDVAEIYGGAVSLEESEDLGGLLVRLRLPIVN